MDSFWDFFWFTISFFFLMAYLLVMFQIITDLFRDKSTSGVAKAVWVFFLIVLPMLTALAYLVMKGQAMTERTVAAAAANQQQAEEYVRGLAGTSPADQIAQAKALLDSGAISQEEFDQLKARALA
jgi:uncharacterized membrane protein